PDLRDAAGSLPGALVSLVDLANGARLETSAIAGERNSGVLSINGAAAHLINPGELVILIAYAQMNDAEAANHEPKVVHVDSRNRIISLGHDPAEAISEGTPRPPHARTLRDSQAELLDEFTTSQ